MLVRDPRKVPARVAIAASDFCRRAGRSPSPEEVRLALARLGSDRDRDVLALCEKEPPATPLSPHALVDVVFGMPPDQAAALEAEGAYLPMALEAAEAAVRFHAVAPPQEAEAEAEAPPPGRARAQRKRKKAEAPAPIRRPRAEVEARREALEPLPHEEEAPPPPPRPGRKPAAPSFGRFVEGPKAKRPFEELEAPGGKETLSSLLAELHGNPAALVRRMDVSWQGRRGPRFDEDDLAHLIRAHDLEPVREKEERAHLLALVRRNKGFLRPIARAMDRRPAEVRRLLTDYGLRDELKVQRRLAREQALAEKRLPTRLRWILRQGDRLDELGILRDMERALRQDLFEAVDSTQWEEGPPSPQNLLELTRRALDLDAPTWEAAVERFGLLNAAARRLGIPPPGRRGPWGHGR